MRGLKRVGNPIHETPVDVASFTDAWIETNQYYSKRGTTTVASFTDAWIETFLGKYSGLYVSRIFYRCVD